MKSLLDDDTLSDEIASTSNSTFVETFFVFNRAMVARAPAKRAEKLRGPTGFHAGAPDDWFSHTPSGRPEYQLLATLSKFASGALYSTWVHEDFTVRSSFSGIRCL